MELIKRNNEVVKGEDTVIHVGDFTLKNAVLANKIISQLKGKHIFLMGSHDRWAPTLPYVWEGKIDGVYVVACHYAMLTWPRSHYGSIQLFGHTHGRITGRRNQMDVGVDCNNYYPFSFEKIKNMDWGDKNG